MGSLADGIVLADTITVLPAAAYRAVVVCGSHGGLYPGFLAAKAGVRAAIFSDAGIGRDQAGIASLGYLDALGIAASAVSHLSARIGDTADFWKRGVVSRLNEVARAAGVRLGMPCADAARLLRDAPASPSGPLPTVGEGRGTAESGPGLRRRILLLDSAALVLPDDAGQIVVTGSHGGLVGGDPDKALRADACAAVFNDAGIGIEEAGTTRLPALDRRAIAAITVAADSARIGDARSSFEDGIVSRANETALRLGAAIGQPVRPMLLGWSTMQADGDRHTAGVFSQQGRSLSPRGRG